MGSASTTGCTQFGLKMGTTYWTVGWWDIWDNWRVKLFFNGVRPSGELAFGIMAPQLPFPATIATGLSGNTQSFDWTAPPEIAPTRKAVVRVTASDAAGNSQTAASGLVSIIGSGFQPNSSGTFTYDALNRLIQAALNAGRTIQYTWDAAGNLIEIKVSGQ